MTALTDGYLKSASGFYMDSDDKKVQVEITVQWQYEENSAWVDISGKAHLVYSVFSIVSIVSAV